MWWQVYSFGSLSFLEKLVIQKIPATLLSHWICNINPFNVVSFPTDSASYMKPAIEKWNEENNTNAFKIPCTSRLLDPSITGMIGPKTQLGLIMASIRNCFPKHHINIRRRFSQYIEELNIETGFPYFKETTRAWGSDFR